MALQVLVVLVSLGAVSGSGAALRPCPWSSQQPSLNWESLGHRHSCRTATALQHKAPVGPSHLGDGGAEPHVLSQHGQGPAQVAQSSSKAHSLWTESVIHSLLMAVHWQVHPIHHRKQPWAQDQQPWRS